MDRATVVHRHRSPSKVEDELGGGRLRIGCREREEAVNLFERGRTPPDEGSVPWRGVCTGPGEHRGSVSPQCLDRPGPSASATLLALHQGRG